MFGTQFRCGDGMCTRGINMQLIKSKYSSSYDYVIVLDTEGLRAPEFAGRKFSDNRDNKMATMSIIPSDTTIMMTVGDDDSAVKDILPIVLRAYQSSSIAEESGLSVKPQMTVLYKVEFKIACRIPMLDSQNFDFFGKSRFFYKSFDFFIKFRFSHKIPLSTGKLVNYRWEMKIFSSTNETAFYVGVFSIWSLLDDWVVKFELEFLLAVYFATPNRKHTYVIGRFICTGENVGGSDKTILNSDTR